MLHQQFDTRKTNILCLCEMKDLNIYVLISSHTYKLHICDDFSHMQSELTMRFLFIVDHNLCIC